MRVLYTDTHWIEFESRFVSKRPINDISFGYIGFGCKRLSCNRPYLTCNVCKLSFTYFSNINIKK